MSTLPKSYKTIPINNYITHVEYCCMNFDTIRSFLIKHYIAYLLILYAAIIRLYMLGDYTMFLGDQGRDAIAIRNIATFANLTGIGPTTSIGNVFLGPFYYYLMAPFLLLFNFNPAGLGYGMAMLSIVCMVWIYHVLKEEFGIKLAYITLIFLATSATLLDLSRFSWNPNLLPYSSLLFLFYVYKLVRSKKVVDAVIAGLLFSASVQFHYLAYFLIIPAGIYVLIYKFLVIQHTRHIHYGLLAFLGLLLPLIAFDIKHGFINSHSFVRALLEQKSRGSNLLVSLQEVIEKAIQFIFIPSGLVKINLALVILVLIILTAIVVYLYRSKNHLSQFIVLLILNIATFLLLFSSVQSMRVAHYYSNIIASIFVCIAALFVLEENNRIVKNKQLIHINTIACSILLSVYVLLQFPHYYFNNSPNYLVQEAKTVAEKISSMSREDRFILASLPPTNDNGQFRYFLQSLGKNIITGTNKELYFNAKELIVICHNNEDCKPIGDPKWEIAAFAPTQITDTEKIYSYTIYRLIR
jgi:4-amino-4-deoxy-L-arabinose transferase-like glycosyltransferase